MYLAISDVLPGIRVKRKGGTGSVIYRTGPDPSISKFPEPGRVGPDRRVPLKS